MHRFLLYITLAIACLFHPSLSWATAPFKGNLTHIPFEELGSPMWVVYRDGSSSWRNAVSVQKVEGEFFYKSAHEKLLPFTHGEIPSAGRPFLHLPAVQSNYSGYIEPNSMVPQKTHVQAGDVIIRRFARNNQGERVFFLEVVKAEKFMQDYVLADGAEIQLAGVRSENFAPKVTSRAEAKMILSSLESDSKNTVNYSMVPENFLQKIILKIDNKLQQIEFRLAPQTGYLFAESGQKITIFSGTLLRYENGVLVGWVSPEFYTGFKAAFQSHPITNGNLNFPQIITLSTKSSSSGSLESLLDKYLLQRQYNLESFKSAQDLPFYTPHILEGYLRFQEINEQIKANFPKRHSSVEVAEKLRMDIAEAKEIRQRTRAFIRQERFSFEDLLTKRLSKGIRSGLAVENLFRKIAHGTLLSGILVVGGLEAVEAVLMRLSEEDTSSSEAQAITLSVQQRESYLSVLQQNPQLVVYMPESVAREALYRSDFDRPALLAELYLFNNFLEESQIPDSFAARLLSRIEQEYAQSSAQEQVKKSLAALS